jgi:hypothetical protein
MHTQTTTVRLLALASVAISVTARVAFAQDDEEPPNVEASGDIVEGQGPEEPAPDLPPEAASTDSAGELAKDLANPIADLISLPFQLNYDEGFGPKDAGRFTLNIQPVIPFDISEDWNLITRTIVPVIHQESIADGVDSDFGLGDTLQSFFFSPKQPVNGVQIGPRYYAESAGGGPDRPAVSHSDPGGAASRPSARSSSTKAADPVVLRRLSERARDRRCRLRQPRLPARRARLPRQPADRVALRHARGLREVGAVNGTVGIFETLMDARTLFLTANTESVYAVTWLDLKDGRWWSRARPTRSASSTTSGSGT